MIKLSEVNFDTRFSKLEQRVLDCLVENVIMEKKVIHKSQKLPKIKEISFSDNSDFQVRGSIHQDVRTRLVPHYTRGIEPVFYELLPVMRERDFVFDIQVMKDIYIVRGMRTGSTNDPEVTTNKYLHNCLVVTSLKLFLSDEKFLDLASYVKEMIENG